jgi:hypothetical protein
LKEEFQGSESERTKKMQVLNLRREFEALKMKETETVREFSDRISKVVSQIRLLGEELIWRHSSQCLHEVKILETKNSILVPSI